MDSWQTKRTFGWGIVLFLDRDSGDVPELSDSPVSQSPHGFVVKVHHAEDVDLDGFAGDKGVPPAEVQILIWLDREAPGPGTFSGVIEFRRAFSLSAMPSTRTLSRSVPVVGPSKSTVNLPSTQTGWPSGSDAPSWPSLIAASACEVKRR